MQDSLSHLQKQAVAFRDARDWAQFHRPKDLAIGLSVEAAELAELFLWKSDTELAQFERESPQRDRLGEEMADVLIFLLYLAEHAGIDLAEATAAKMTANAEKYPVEQARGSAAKYDQLAEARAERGEADA